MTDKPATAAPKVAASLRPEHASPPTPHFEDSHGPQADAIAREIASLRGQRVAVAMSGGVDSAVALYLLREAGVDVVGLSLRLHDPDPDNPLAPRACCPPDDLQDARRVSEQLDVPFYVIDAREAFDAAVVRPFVRAYVEGRTPNPCVGCNSFVKLGRLAARARALGCTRLATGHYARVTHDDGVTRLFTGVDRDKDQSYFLFGVAEKILSTLLFPLGAHTKEDVRDTALASKMPVAHKLESQEVCFVGGAGAGGFVRRQPEAIGDFAGPIVDEAGRVLGQHAGVMNFTVGQRKGIGIAAKHPLHVLNIDADQRKITVGPAESLDRSGLFAARASWPAGRPSAPVRATVKIRYRDPGTAATVTPLDGDRVRVDFDAPVRAVAPGQAAVFYRGDEVVGGAWIEEGITT